MASDNLCSVASDDDDDDEEDDVFAAIQDVIKKPIIKIDRSILKRKSPETADGTPRRTRFVTTLFIIHTLARVSDRRFFGHNIALH